MSWHQSGRAHILGTHRNYFQPAPLMSSDRAAPTEPYPSWLGHYWGKTNHKRDYELHDCDGALLWKSDTDEEGYPLRYHLLAYHNLDVAACGKAIIESDPLLCKRLAARLGVREEIVADFVALFLMWHDLGKFSREFQNLTRLLAERFADPLGIELPKEGHYPVHHSTLGYLVWRDKVHPALSEEDWFGIEAPPVDLWDYFDPIAQAIEGHHGRPPSEVHHRDRQHFVKKNREDALAFVRATRELFDFERPFVSWNYDERVPQAERASWLLAGVAVLADWIGSNAGDKPEEHYFKFEEEPRDLRAYWQDAQNQARAAVQEVGILPVVSSGTSGLTHLFPKLPGKAKPTLLQQFVCDEEKLPLDGGPHLFILEDATGSGKTEAAVLLAHRLMQAGYGNGLYLGLPTMATANAMHDRLTKTVERLYDGDNGGPSFVLAHSRRDTHPSFLDIVNASADGEEAYDGSKSNGETEKDQTGEAQCAAWLADNRKKALLAHVGVGTIDQALIGALPAKHQSLRLLGLARNVLIVDEVHAYDEYVSELLARLLRFQATMGGSAILLSATLTQRQRQHLCQAFRAGLWPEVSADDAAEEARENALRVELEERGTFPLVTHCTRTHLDESDERSLPPDERSKHHVTVEFIEPEFVALPEAGKASELKSKLKKRLANEVPPTVEAAFDTVRDRLLAVARAGGCACWIRNTVDDAVDGFKLLGGEDNDRVTLFHARFALSDRLNEKEAFVLEHFGPGSTPEQRRGQILVATQVVEQSLDLDFDYLVSDLAPIDLLIQRAGRLHRHRRGKDENERPDGLRAPTLGVFAPAYTDDPHETWFKEIFPKARYVYPHTGILWRTAKALKQTGRVHIPEDARPLLETVYAPDTPEGKDLALWAEAASERGWESEAAEPSAWAIPSALEKACNEALNEMKRARSEAHHNALHVDGGYGGLKAGAAHWYSDKHTPTRLGEPTVTVRLARWEGHGGEAEIVPLRCNDLGAFRQAQATFETESGEARKDARRTLLHEWHGSELTVRQHLVAEASDWKAEIKASESARKEAEKARGKADSAPDEIEKQQAATDAEQEAREAFWPSAASVEHARAAMPDGCKWSVLLLLKRQGDDWIGPALANRWGDTKPATVTYSTSTGLRAEVAK